MWHRLFIIGRLTKDANSMRYTPDGKAVLDFNVAVDDGYGENKRAIWLKVTVWQKTAEACVNLKKGAMVLCETTLQHENGNPRVWESNGKHGSSFEVTASNVRFLSAKQDEPVEDDLPL